MAVRLVLSSPLNCWAKWSSRHASPYDYRGGVRGTLLTIIMGTKLKLYLPENAIKMLLNLTP